MRFGLRKDGAEVDGDDEKECFVVFFGEPIIEITDRIHLYPFQYR